MDKIIEQKKGLKKKHIPFIIGGALLVLLFGGILVTRQMGEIHEPIASKLQLAAQCALENNWVRAESFFQEAEADWKQREHFRSCFADHTPVEEIDGDFELLLVFCGTRDRTAFAGGCRELARKVAAVGEAHQLVWWNLL